MSLYSTTRVEAITRRSLNPRTRNICIEYKLFTVRDIWYYYQSHYTFKGLSGVGKKGNKQLMRICTKVAEIMRAQPVIHTAVTPPPASVPVPFPPPAAVPAVAPAVVADKDFSITILFNSLDKESKIVAENFYRHFARRLPWNAEQTLLTLCKGLTLEALVNRLSAKPSLFQPYFETTKGRSSEVGKFLSAINNFYAGEDFAQCLLKPALALLRQQMNALLGCKDGRMYNFLTAHFDKLASGGFPFGAFIDTVITANTVLHEGTRHSLYSAGFSCATNRLVFFGQVARNMRVGQEKMWKIFEEKGIFRLVRSAIALLQNYGFVVPPEYLLSDEPFHVCGRLTGINPRSFGDLFILQLFNPAYRVVEYKVKQSVASILVQPWLQEQFYLTMFLTAINRLQSGCIRAAYTKDLIEFMDSYYKTDLFPEAEKRLFHIMASLVQQAYDLTTSDDGELELKRTSKKQTWEYMYDFLKEEDRPCDTTDIMEALLEMNIRVTRETIRQNIYQRGEIFKMMGQGEYGLQEWKREYDFAGGTILNMAIVR